MQWDCDRIEVFWGKPVAGKEERAFTKGAQAKLPLKGKKQKSRNICSPINPQATLMTPGCNVSFFFPRKCGSGWFIKKRLRPFVDGLLRFCRCEVLKPSGTFNSKTDSSPNLPTFKRIKHWRFMNMDELYFEIKRRCLIFCPHFAVSAFSSVSPPEHNLRYLNWWCLCLLPPR